MFLFVLAVLQMKYLCTTKVRKYIHIRHSEAIF
jgi:hypothetical protein